MVVPSGPLRPTYDETRGASVGKSEVLDTVWDLERATGALRLWNPFTQAWYLTDRETEAARRREADQESARTNQEAARLA